MNLYIKKYTRLLREIVRTYHNWKVSLPLEEGFINDFKLYNELSASSDKASMDKLYPCLYDKTELTKIDPVYFYQDNWAFEKIVKVRPEQHYDIGSHHKYVALLAQVVPVTMIDIRPLTLPVNNLAFIKGSLLDLPFNDDSISSLSSLCVVEHIGLGRYGDPIDPLGSEKAFKELSRVIMPSGNLYISVPIEKVGKVYFNAHRSFSEEFIKNSLAEFSLVEAKYIYNSEFTDSKKDKFGIGCYHFKKK